SRAVFGVLAAARGLVAAAAESGVPRRFSAALLPPPPPAHPSVPPPRPPVFALIVLALTLVGFGISSPIGIAPAWVACVGAAVLAARGLARRDGALSRMWRAVKAPLLALVLAPGGGGGAAVGNGVDSATRDLLPTGDSLAALLVLAAIAAVLANVVNNLPALLLLLPLVTPGGAPAVLAVLIGVNVGSNLTYVGSLANLLWRNVL